MDIPRANVAQDVVNLRQRTGNIFALGPINSLQLFARVQAFQVERPLV